MNSDLGDDPREEDDFPRQGWLASMPKRSLTRIFALLALLAGIFYLRTRTTSIAAWLSEALRVEVGAGAPPSPVKVRLAAPSRPSDGSTP